MPQPQGLREPPVQGGGAVLLDVRDLRTSFELGDTTVYAVQGLDMSVRSGERLGVVGESGSGKSVAALSVMGMVRPPGKVTGGEVRFQGEELRGLPESRMRHLRGSAMAMIPQNPLTSLNPVLTVGTHFQEILRLHMGMSRREALERSIELLRQVGVPDPTSRVNEYPHRLSGGQRQRVMIALAMACEPQLLIADEPTTALDVTIQAQILELFDGLVAEGGLGAILITHNLGIVASHCDRVLVMYAGRVMETASVRELFAHPSHPYTVGLLRCVPRLSSQRVRRFHAIPGLPPRVTELVPGCPFAPRCERATDRCRQETPPLEQLADGHSAACWHPVGGEA